MKKLSLLVAPATVAAFMAIPASASFAGGGAQHGAITITSNSDFVSCQCVTAGSGTASNPYVIGPWAVSSPSGGPNGGWSVKVDNSTGAVTAFFNIVGITSAYDDTNPADPDIWLVNIHTPTAITFGKNGSTSSTANNNGTGVRLDGSSNIRLDNLEYNKMNGPGVFLSGSSAVTIDNVKLKSVGEARPNGDGIYAENSSNIQIGTGADCPNNQPCNDLTYDEGFGIDLVNTHDVVINDTAVSANDTGGYVLDGTNTYRVTIQHSHASGLGPICHTVDNEKENSGYFTDLQGALMLINGAHDNAFADDTFNIPGSAPMPSIGSGGNGFYVNACAGFVPQPFSPVEAPAGSGNTFSNVCYSLPTNYPGLPPSSKNCPGS
ncbi:MAG TPA: right-handed parallel beta-helix repeat-containing protein [Streptosporangiaceae bacterium]